jgi:SAM-dependent methyltransferase
VHHILQQYGPDLSRIHHEGFAALAGSAAPAIVRLLRSAGIRRGMVVDLGCGSGILAKHLLARGYDVQGIDASAAMIRIARRVAPGATFTIARAATARLPRCRAIVATGESITYLNAAARPDALLRRVIHRAARALEPGGLLIFDAIVANPRRPLANRTWRASDAWAVLTESSEDMQRGIVTRQITSFVRAGTGFRRSYERHRVGVFRRKGVLKMLEAEGFHARTLRRYGRAPLPPRRLVFVARLKA